MRAWSKTKSYSGIKKKVYLVQNKYWKGKMFRILESSISNDKFLNTDYGLNYLCVRSCGLGHTRYTCSGRVQCASSIVKAYIKVRRNSSNLLP